LVSLGFTISKALMTSFETVASRCVAFSALSRASLKYKQQVNLIKLIQFKLKDILPLKLRKRHTAHLYCHILTNCNQVWHLSVEKEGRVNKRPLRYTFKEKSASYQDLLQRIRLPFQGNLKNPRHAIDNKQLYIRQSSICNLKILPPYES